MVVREMYGTGQGAEMLAAANNWCAVCQTHAQPGGLTTKCDSCIPIYHIKSADCVYRYLSKN